MRELSVAKAENYDKPSTKQAQKNKTSEKERFFCFRFLVMKEGCKDS